MTEPMDQLHARGRENFAELVEGGEKRLDALFATVPGQGELAVGTAYGARPRAYGTGQPDAGSGYPGRYRRGGDGRPAAERPPPDGPGIGPGAGRGVRSRGLDGGVRGLPARGFGG